MSYTVTLTFPKKCPDCDLDRADPRCQCSIFSFLVQLPKPAAPAGDTVALPGPASEPGEIYFPTLSKLVNPRDK